MFWIQTPLAVIAGIGIFFSIPKHFTSGPKKADGESIISKLFKIDYLGAISLVCYSLVFGKLITDMTADLSNCPLPFRPLMASNSMASHNHLPYPLPSFRLQRNISGQRPDHPSLSPQITWRTAKLHRPDGNHGIKMDGALLHTSLLAQYQRLEPSLSRKHSSSHKRRLCTRRDPRRSLPHKKSW